MNNGYMIVISRFKTIVGIILQVQNISLYN